ncbi:MAG: IPT/TIG domain-containing protein, partial [Cytophagales bacterium]
MGTSVTITGTNFSTTPANNVVKFNGVTATVTASTATSITA